MDYICTLRFSFMSPPIYSIDKESANQFFFSDTNCNSMSNFNNPSLNVWHRAVCHLSQS